MSAAARDRSFFRFLKRRMLFASELTSPPKSEKSRTRFLPKKIFRNRAKFARSKGEFLPFADESFDVVLCRVALPYMNNRKTIAEVARILKPNGVFLLKTHAPPFYSAMLKERIKTLNPKQIAYPLICVAGSLISSVKRQAIGKRILAGQGNFSNARIFGKGICKKRFGNKN